MEGYSLQLAHIALGPRGLGSVSPTLIEFSPQPVQDLRLQAQDTPDQASASMRRLTVSNLVQVDQSGDE
jgi:hypothetical protein